MARRKVPVLPLRNDAGDLRVDPQAAVPLYHQLKAALRQQIAARTWTAGQMIPSENELAASWGVSVGTVKKALADLVREGILKRRQGKGTFVTRPDFQRSFIRFFRYGQGPGEERAVPGSKVLATEVTKPSSRVKGILRLGSRERVIRIRRLRTLHGVPFVIEDLYLPEKTFRGFERRDISRGLLYPVYDQEYATPIIWADEFMEPKKADREVARALGLAPGDPVMSIERIAYTFGDRPVEFRVSLGRGDRFRYHIEIR